MEKTKLSFCIPTLNRADFIGETLDGLITQVTDEVEIVIVDGASTDNTKEVVKSYQEKCPQIRYFRHEKNMGVDHDYNSAVEYAKGEYCWIMTDDDLLKPGAVESVLKEISSNEYDLIVVNAEVRSKDLKKVIQNRVLDYSENRIYSPSENKELFVDIVNYLSFSGGMIINRSFWMSRERKKYFGSLFIEVGVIFQKPLKGNVLIVSEPWVLIRYGNALWSPKKFEVSMFKWPDLIWSFDNYSEEDKKKVIIRDPWRKVRILTMYRAVGAFSLRDYYSFIKPHMNFSLKRMVIKIVACIPSFILNLLWIACLSFFPDKSPMWLYDLKNSKYNYLF